MTSCSKIDIYFLWQLIDISSVCCSLSRWLSLGNRCVPVYGWHGFGKVNLVSLGYIIEYSFVQPSDSGSMVTISEPVLLDESPPDLNSINITSTGRLVWSPDVDIDLRVNYIWVAGRLDIGSEDCPYEGETTITLTGTSLLCPPF